MKVSCNEGVASHVGPESCGGDREVVVEALTGESSSGTSATRLYVQQDANYNVTAITGTSGSVYERFIEDPYGANLQVLNPAWSSTSDLESWLYYFQGGRMDPATDLIHFGARDYSPSDGRWVEPDPIGYGDGMDYYQGFDGDPAIYVDPSGLFPSGPSIAQMCPEVATKLKALQQEQQSMIDELEGDLNHADAVLFAMSVADKAYGFLDSENGKKTAGQQLSEVTLDQVKDLVKDQIQDVIKTNFSQELVGEGGEAAKIGEALEQSSAALDKAGPYVAIGKWAIDAFGNVADIHYDAEALTAIDATLAPTTQQQAGDIDALKAQAQNMDALSQLERQINTPGSATGCDCAEWDAKLDAMKMNLDQDSKRLQQAVAQSKAALDYTMQNIQGLLNVAHSD